MFKCNDSQINTTSDEKSQMTKGSLANKTNILILPITKLDKPENNIKTIIQNLPNCKNTCNSPNSNNFQNKVDNNNSNNPSINNNNNIITNFNEDLKLPSVNSMNIQPNKEIVDDSDNMNLIQECRSIIIKPRVKKTNNPGLHIKNAELHAGLAGPMPPLNIDEVLARIQLEKQNNEEANYKSLYYGLLQKLYRNFNLNPTLLPNYNNNNTSIINSNNRSNNIANQPDKDNINTNISQFSNVFNPAFIPPLYSSKHNKTFNSSSPHFNNNNFNNFNNYNNSNNTNNNFNNNNQKSNNPKIFNTNNSAFNIYNTGVYSNYMRNPPNLPILKPIPLNLVNLRENAINSKYHRIANRIDKNTKRKKFKIEKKDKEVGNEADDIDGDNQKTLQCSDSKETPDEGENDNKFISRKRMRQQEKMKNNLKYFDRFDEPFKNLKSKAFKLCVSDQIKCFEESRGIKSMDPYIKIILQRLRMVFTVDVKKYTNNYYLYKTIRQIIVDIFKGEYVKVLMQSQVKKSNNSIKQKNFKNRGQYIPVSFFNGTNTQTELDSSKLDFSKLNEQNQNCQEEATKEGSKETYCTSNEVHDIKMDFESKLNKMSNNVYYQDTFLPEVKEEINKEVNKDRECEIYRESKETMEESSVFNEIIKERKENNNEKEINNQVHEIKENDFKESNKRKEIIFLSVKTEHSKELKDSLQVVHIQNDIPRLAPIKLDIAKVDPTTADIYPPTLSQHISATAEPVSATVQPTTVEPTTTEPTTLETVRTEQTTRKEPNIAHSSKANSIRDISFKCDSDDVEKEKKRVSRIGDKSEKERNVEMLIDNIDSFFKDSRSIGILNKTYYQIIIEFRESEDFIKYCRKLKQEQSARYIKNFNLIASNFEAYLQRTKIENDFMNKEVKMI